MASGDFCRLLGDAQIPPLPAAVASLLEETGKDEPDLPRVCELIAATPEIAAKVLQTVNSAYFGLSKPVASILRAVTLLGLQQVRPLIYSFSVRKTLATPDNGLFDQQGFWSDALLKALLARALADSHCREEREEAFTAMLLSDIALPVLLTSWGEYYQPVVERWQVEAVRLSHLEQENFSWDHAQAGAWVLQQWDFPAELVCLVGLHNTDREKLSELGLEESAALPATIAALAPSCLRPGTERARQMIDAALDQLSLDDQSMAELLLRVNQEYRDMCPLFDIAPEPGVVQLELLDRALATKGLGVAC